MRLHRTSSLACGLMLLAVLLVGGCTSEGSSLSTDGGASVTVEPTSTAAADRQPSLESQIATLTGRSDVELVPIEGSQAWLGDDRFAAYVDPETHDEFIADVERGMLLSYDPGTRVFESPSGSPTLPGEPPREVALELAREWAVEYLPERDIDTMRRTALRRPLGQIIEYSVEYTRYVNGARMPEWAHVQVTLPVSDWSTPSRSAFEHFEEYEQPPAPEVSMLEALDTARQASDLDDPVVKAADLSWWKGDYSWSFEFEDASPDTQQFGGHGAWIEIDAMTGEVLGVAGCG